MNNDTLQVLIRDQDAFKKAFRKVNPDRVFSTDPKNELVSFLKGQFKPGRVPYLHEVTLPNGSKIRLKFVDTVKKLFNSKNIELVGKESFLSYIEITVLPVGIKGYCYTTDVHQIVWGLSRSKAKLQHDVKIASITAQAEELGIDLTAAGAVCTLYSENY